MMLSTMVSRMIPMPMETATINTVFSLPINGRFVMCSMGRSHTASIIVSKPNTLPNIKPKMVEKNPQQEMMAARFAFLNR